MTDLITQLIVHRHERMRHEIRTTPRPDPQEGEVLVAIEKFGLTSNNVTYAALGNALPYYDFFPTDEQWSSLPVWGVGTVVASRADGTPEGVRVHGFFPAASHVTMQVGAQTPMGFSAQRPAIPPDFAFYNQYTLVDRDPMERPGHEDLTVVMRPLFLTGLLLADYLTLEERMRGAEVVLVSSAASKTSYGLASALREAGGKTIVGLASERSKAAAEAMGPYDRVLLYDELESLAGSPSTVYVDVSGDTAVRERLAAHLDGALRSILAVGLTHWQHSRLEGKPSAAGVPTETFFAPTWAARRRKEGGEAFMAQLMRGWAAQISSAAGCFTVVRKTGVPALTESFEALVEGRVQPQEAWVCSL